MHNRPRVDPNLVSDAEKADRKRKIEKYRYLTSKVLNLRKQRSYSEESLKLCTTVLEINPEYYTMWNFRREILQKFFEDTPDQKSTLCAADLGVVERALRRNPKSYNAWFHRTWIINQGTSDLERELKLCNKMLDLDSRNFHCWDYRRFIVRKSQTPLSSEFQFTTHKIEQNFSNYSSWHYRSTLLPQLYEGKDLVAKLDSEFEWVLQAFYTEPGDQSAWLYHRWLLAKRGATSFMYSSDLAVNEENSSVEDSKQILTRELQMCTELLEEEPDCKWVILTAVILTHSLFSRGILEKSDVSAKLEQYCKKLKLLDPLRSEYYSMLEEKVL
eukprot:110054_1